jgi:hypothetical protein
VTDDGPPPASPLWRAWQGSSVANRVLAGLALLGVVVGAALLTGGDEDEPVSRTTAAAASASPSAPATASTTPSPAVSPSATQGASPSAVPSALPPPGPSSPSPSAAPTAAPAPTPSASPAASAELELDGDDLGVTRVGAPYADAVQALTAVLGPPVADPSPTSSCVGAGDREVEWPEFRIAVTGGRVSGWSSTDGRLATPSGVGIGTTVTELQEVYGDRLELYDANPDSGPGFAVAGVELSGALTGPGGDDRVTALFNRACSPP